MSRVQDIGPAEARNGGQLCSPARPQPTPRSPPFAGTPDLSCPGNEIRRVIAHLELAGRPLPAVGSVPGRGRPEPDVGQGGGS